MLLKGNTNLCLFIAGPLPKKVQERQEEKAKANTIEEGPSDSFENAFTDLSPDEPVVG